MAGPEMLASLQEEPDKSGESKGFKFTRAQNTVIKCPHERNTDSILTSVKKISVFWWGG